MTQLQTIGEPAGTAWDEQTRSILRAGLPERFRASALPDDARLREDLGLDSLAFVALLVRIHRAFGFELQQLSERAPQLSSVGSLIQCVRELSGASSS